MSSAKDSEQVPGIPDILLQEAQAAAAGAQGDKEAQAQGQAAADSSRHHHHLHHLETNVPPPAYSANQYGELDISQNGMDTGAKIGDDGRVNIKINQHSKKLTNLLAPALRHQLELQNKKDQEPTIPDGLGEYEGLPPPPMNIVIQIVGSRGDVQPFVALGQVLKKKYNHRVRIATHPTFRDFVTENGLEFFSIGGDPAELMAFMVKNPGLMPGIDTLKSGDVGKRRKSIYEIILGCWRSCIEAGDGTGIPASDAMLDRVPSFESGAGFTNDPTAKPFIADAIIANPPSFAHVHIAEKLGIPLHLMFTMPWSPTQSFPHPLANLISSNADANMTNFISYALVDMLTWQGLGDVINRFRENTLHLEPVSIMWAPGMTSRLRIPWTYCWSPALIPKPADWGPYIDISGFYFLNLATNYTPPKELADFLAAGEPPVYIGFGSIVVDDPNAMTKMIFEAVKKTGQRALVSKGWGGLGADELGVPEGVYMLGNCPHDWLFHHVSCVVHHGGAGTTATGIAMGRPTVVVPFFGDQPFWGAMVARAGAGPMPIPYKTLTADKLADQILTALKPESLERAKELSQKINAEHGNEAGAESFHKQLHMDTLRCSLDPTKVAVWRIRHTDIRLSALGAHVLGNEGLVDFGDLKLYRPREYETEDGPWEPVTGGASALIGTLGNLSMGIADFPVEILKSLTTATKDVHEKHQHEKNGDGSPPTPSSRHGSVASPDKSLTSPSQLSLAKTNQSQTSVTSGTIVPDDHSNDQAVTGEPVDKTETLSQTPTMVSIAPGEEAQPTVSHKNSHVVREEDISHITAETALGGAKAGYRIVSAAMKSPMDFTMSLAKGFHNAPKLYGDTTVRKSDKITGIGSGFKAAGKEFGYGFYDGITGLVTQPMRGAQKEGFAGLVKGAAMGVGGLILKPGAGIWGIPGYTSKGIYASLHSMFGSSVHNFIIAARTAQGYEEWKESTYDQREKIIAAWRSSKLEKKRGGKKYGKERAAEIEQHISRTGSNHDAELVSGFKNTRRLTYDERKVLKAKKEEMKKDKKANAAAAHGDSPKGKHRHGTIGRQKKHCDYCPLDHDSDYHLQHKSALSTVSHPAELPGSEGKTPEQVHAEYEEAIKKSVAATSRGDPEEDAMVERALRASVKELQQQQQSGIVSAGHGSEPQEAGAHRGDDHDEELQRALTQSAEEHHRKQNQTTNGGHNDHDDDNDADLQRAVTESQRHADDVHRQKTEEEIVMEYVKKQSLAEEEARQKKAEQAA